MDANTNTDTKRDEQTGQRLVPLEYVRAVLQLCNIARPKLDAITALSIIEAGENERAFLHRLAVAALLAEKATNNVVVH